MSDNYPAVEFIYKKPEEILKEMVATWEKEMGRALGNADPVRLMLGWEAAIDAQLYTVINESAKLNVPRYAFGNYLDSIAENFYWNLQRMEATKATTTLRFTLSVEAETDTPVPIGTIVTSDGSVNFVTTETVYIQEGEIYADVPAECTVAGTVGNGFLPGALKVIVSNDNVETLQSVTNLTTSEGGSARETDEAFYERMRLSMSAYSTAGSEESYIYHALSANPQIADVKAVTPEPGAVTVYVLLQNGELPGEEMLEEIKETLDDRTIRPMTDLVTVSAPAQTGFTVDITWYAQSKSELGREAVEANVNAAVQEYIAWQTAAMGRDINPSKLHFLLMQTGAKRITIQSPEFTHLDETEVAVIREDATMTFGGEEDE